MTSADKRMLFKKINELVENSSSSFSCEIGSDIEKVLGPKFCSYLLMKYPEDKWREDGIFEFLARSIYCERDAKNWDITKWRQLLMSWMSKRRTMLPPEENVKKLRKPPYFNPVSFSREEKDNKTFGSIAFVEAVAAFKAGKTMDQCMEILKNNAKAKDLKDEEEEIASNHV